MLRLTPELPYLDSAGHIYVPLAGPDRTCLKLNRKASQLWREATRGPIELHVLAPADRDFLLGLAQRGVLHPETAGDTETAGDAGATGDAETTGDA